MNFRIYDKTTSTSRNNNRNGPMDIAKPVELGKEYDVKINQTSSRGDGIPMVRGFVVYVKKSKVGEENVKVKVTHVAETYALANLVV